MQKYKSCKRWNEPGEAHELTFTCFHRFPLLSKERSCTWLVESIQRTRARYDFDVWAYVIMPEHVHLLINPRRIEYDISAILKAIKWPVAVQAKRYLELNAPDWIVRRTDRQPNGRSSFRFWQRGGGYDRNIRREQTLGAMVEYIHNNPVRRELVNDPSDWRWSSNQWYDGRRDVPLQMDETIWL